MKIKELIKKLIMGRRYSSETMIKYYRSLGMEIGEGTTVFDPITVLIDETRPWLVKIGNDVKITKGVTILTHGYDWSVLKGVYGDILGSSGKVSIGNNVFIGVNSTILKGVDIGDNVIIGANSVVTDNVPSNVVAAGNPCKVIMDIDEYHKKRLDAQLKEATELVQCYRLKYDKDPDEKALHEFFWLFCDSKNELTDTWKSMMKLHGNEEYSYKALSKHHKSFENIDNFLRNV